jgi:hypothetical protein
VRAPGLDRSAGLVLGLGITAMPFAGSLDEEAERWLRLLRGYGRAALVLASLGIREQPVQPEPDQIDLSKLQLADPARQVAEQAVQEAAGRGASAADTLDVLSAVLSVYGEVFERTLHRHGCEAWQLRELLDLERVANAG